jgi:hypothetical protein
MLTIQSSALPFIQKRMVHKIHKLMLNWFTKDKMWSVQISCTDRLKLGQKTKNALIPNTKPVQMPTMAQIERTNKGKIQDEIKRIKYVKKGQS